MHLLRRSVRLFVIVAALSLALSASASASNVTVSPGGNVTGNGTTDWFLRAGSGTFQCRVSTLTATLAGRAGAFPVSISTNVQLNFGNCTLIGVGGYTITCTATGVLSVTGVTVGGVTPLSLSNINCLATITGVCSARITGTVPASYSNGTGQLAILAAGQAITISGSTCGTLFPNGTGTFTGPSGANFFYNLTPRQTITAV